MKNSPETNKSWDKPVTIQEFTALVREIWGDEAAEKYEKAVTSVETKP